MAGGRPTKYKEDYPKRAYKLCLLGATDKQLADFFEVNEDTVNKWKIDYPEFSESLRAGKDDADAVIAQSLFNRAKGYSHPEDKIFNDDGQAMVVPTIKHYPPDTTACIFWLKNRQKANWRDRTETALTGADGADLTINVNLVEE
jgi:hypothetical protein